MARRATDSQFAGKTGECRAGHDMIELQLVPAAVTLAMLAIALVAGGRGDAQLVKLSAQAALFGHGTASRLLQKPSTGARKATTEEDAENAESSVFSPRSAFSAVTPVIGSHR